MFGSGGDEVSVTAEAGAIASSKTRAVLVVRHRRSFDRRRVDRVFVRARSIRT